MDKIAHMVGEKVGEAVEGAIKHTLRVKDSNKDSDKKKGGGGLSLFGGNKKKDQGKKDEGKGGFISNLFDKGDDNKGTGKASGFTGLFSEQEGAGAGASDGGVCEYNPTEGPAGHSGGTGGDLYDDLLDVAAEISKEQ